MNHQAEKVAQKKASGFNLSLFLKKSISLVNYLTNYLLLLWILDAIRQGVCPSPFNGFIEHEKSGKIYRYLVWEFYPCIYMLKWVLVFGFYFIKNWKTDNIAKSLLIMPLCLGGAAIVVFLNCCLFFFNYEFFSNNRQVVQRHKAESGTYLTKCDILGGALSADTTVTRKEIFLLPEIKWVYDSKTFKDPDCTVPY